MESFLRGLPKAELHLHIEGTLEPDLAFELADRNAIELPFASGADLRAAYDFTDLQSFLDVYYPVSAVLRTERDFYDLATAYFRRAAADGVVRAEVFFDPQTHTKRGVAMGTIIDGLSAALADAESNLGVAGGLIMCFLRHLPQEAALATFEEALPFIDRILGVGLDSSEVGHPPEKFTDVFGRARERGLHVVAHAGEEGPPGYIVGALDHLGAERIDHGIRCLEDPDLVSRLASERIPLTVCPLSNVRLRVFEKLEQHTLPEMLQAGLVVTINSDDPSYFGGYVGDNYVAIQETLGLSRDRMVRIARDSLEACFVDDDTRREMIGRLTAYVEGHRLEPAP